MAIIGGIAAAWALVSLLRGVSEIGLALMA
jgi:hypothetical protein